MWTHISALTFWKNKTFPKLPFWTLDTRSSRNSDCLGRDSTKLTQLVKMKHQEQKCQKFWWAEKILGVEYRSAFNFGTHRDKCLVGWNCAFLTLRENGPHAFPTTFRDEQETLDALPLICCRFPRNWHLSKIFTHRSSSTQPTDNISVGLFQNGQFSNLYAKDFWNIQLTCNEALCNFFANRIEKCWI